MLVVKVLMLEWCESLYRGSPKVLLELTMSGSLVGILPGQISEEDLEELL